MPDSPLQVGDFESADATTGVCLGTASPSPSPTPGPAEVFVVASTDLNLPVGAVVEATMSCASPNTTGGFVVGAAGSATGSGTAFLWDCGTQQFMIGARTAGSFKPAAVYDRKPGFPLTAAVSLRLLVRTAASGTTTATSFWTVFDRFPRMSQPECPAHAPYET